jgi:hypothetical protein
MRNWRRRGQKERRHEEQGKGGAGTRGDRRARRHTDKEVTEVARDGGSLEAC